MLVTNALGSVTILSESGVCTGRKRRCNGSEIGIILVSKSETIVFIHAFACYTGWSWSRPFAIFRVRIHYDFRF